MKNKKFFKRGDLNMKTSIIGFPRIGENRELKFASEKYFRKEIEAEDMEEQARDLRKKTLESSKGEGHRFYFF